MNQRIRDLAITGGIYDCICDPYDKLKNGDPYSSVMVDLERFAELIVGECSRIADDWVNNEDNGENYPSDKIKQHFGVAE